MRRRQINKIRRLIRYGNKQFILSNIEINKVRVKEDLLRLRETQDELSRQYCEQRSKWTAIGVAQNARPIAVSDQTRVATLAFIGALAANLIEALVAGWVSGWVVAPILLAILLPISIKTILVILWRNEDQPQETVRKIKIFALAPSLVIFGLAAILLLLVRVLPDELAMKMDLMFSISIMALGIGCLGAAAGLFALAHLYNWSRSLKRAYLKLEAEEMNTKELLKVIETTEAAIGHAPPQQPHATNNSSASLPVRVKSLSLALFALLAVTDTGCASKGLLNTGDDSRIGAATRQGEPAASDMITESDLRIFLDVTCSQSQESYRVAVTSLVKQIPLLVEKNHARHIVIYGFSQSGWDAQTVFDAALPDLRKPAMPAAKRDEMELLRGRKNKAAEDQAQEKYHRLMDQSLAQYRSELSTALSGLSETALLAAVDDQARCTDLNGALARIASLGVGPRRQLVLLVTDGAESCGHTIEPVAQPVGEFKLAIILTTGRSPKRGDILFSDRRAELLRAAPWAEVGAYHDEDFNVLLNKPPMPKPPESAPMARNGQARN